MSNENKTHAHQRDVIPPLETDINERTCHLDDNTTDCVTYYIINLRIFSGKNEQEKLGKFF